MNSLMRNSSQKVVNLKSVYNFSSISIENFCSAKPRVLGAETRLINITNKFNNVNVRKINLGTNKYCEIRLDSPNCWKCEAVIQSKELFCQSCYAVQKPRDTDHFDIIGVKKSFNVDLAELTRNFRYLQSQLHPDKFTQKSKDEKEISEDYSMLLNTAYKTLLSPIERGLYLLELAGYPLLEGETIMSPEFLYEVMEINEELDDIDNLEDLQYFKETNNLRLENMFKEVEILFEQQDWNSSRSLLGRVKYFTNVHLKIKEKEGDILS